MHDKQSLCVRAVLIPHGKIAGVPCGSGHIRRFLFDTGRRAHFCAYPVRAGRKSPGAGAIS